MRRAHARACPQVSFLSPEDASSVVLVLPQLLYAAGAPQAPSPVQQQRQQQQEQGDQHVAVDGMAKVSSFLSDFQASAAERYVLPCPCPLLSKSLVCA